MSLVDDLRTAVEVGGIDAPLMVDLLPLATRLIEEVHANFPQYESSTVRSHTSFATSCRRLRQLSVISRLLHPRQAKLLA